VLLVSFLYRIDMDYFNPSEYACNDGCGFSVMHPYTLEAANGYRHYIGVPVKVTSGCRCPSHNKAVGGAPASWHMPRYKDGEMISWAMDLKVDSPQEAADWMAVNYPDINVIVYNTFIHIDSRNRY